jgi:peptidyl-prolyl cis-trans isomerase SurA
MKCFFIIVAGVPLVFGGFAQAELVSAVGIVVNDSVITSADIQDGYVPRAQTAARVYAGDPQRFEVEVQKIRDQEIERQVEDKLILHEFVTSGYETNVVEAFIDDRIRDDIQRQFYGDRSRLIKTLQAEGKTYETYRREQRERFIIDYMNYQNSSNPRKILISPLKISQYYDVHKDTFKIEDEVKLRMIVLAQPAGAAPGTAKAMADEVLAKINSGASFAEMASVYSSGSQRAKGGDCGWVDHTYFKPELTQAAFSLKPGQHSGVLELPEGCYLLQVDDVRQAHVKSLTEVRDEIERTLKAEENSRLRNRWIDRLKRKSFIEYY